MSQIILVLANKEGDASSLFSSYSGFPRTQYMVLAFIQFDILSYVAESLI